MALYVDKKYTSKNTAPLAWHKFSRFVRCPLGIIFAVGNLIQLNNGAQISELLICINIMILISIGLQVAFFIGSFGWKRYAWKALIAGLFYDALLYFCIVAIAPENEASSIVNVLGYATVTYLQYVYYKKRELLFNNSKYDVVEQVSNDSSSIVNDNELLTFSNKEFNDDNKKNTQNTPLFCRKCGTKLDPESCFCRKCGTKVEG